MTDNEIIHIWSLCQLEDSQVCETCPLGRSYPWCDEVLQKETLSLINRQKAEIERLEDVNIRLTKAEAIKEFAERLKKYEGRRGVPIATIDNLVKEMVGDDGGSSEKVQMAGDRI